VLSVLKDSLTYRQAETLLAKKGFRIPCQSRFCGLQKWATSLITDDVMSSCKRAREIKHTDPCLGFDGSSPCCREVMYCIILFSHVIQSACCDFIVVNKVLGRNTECQGSRQGMEKEGLEILARKWKDADSETPAITRFVHGNDSHALHPLKTINWQL
jgi:hypothetical protein